MCGQTLLFIVIANCAIAATKCVYVNKCSVLSQVFQRHTEHMDGVCATASVPAVNLWLSNNTDCLQVDCIQSRPVVMCSEPSYWSVSYTAVSAEWSVVCSLVVQFANW